MGRDNPPKRFSCDLGQCQSAPTPALCRLAARNRSPVSNDHAKACAPLCELRTSPKLSISNVLWKRPGRLAPLLSCPTGRECPLWRQPLLQCRQALQGRTICPAGQQPERQREAPSPDSASLCRMGEPTCALELDQHVARDGDLIPIAVGSAEGRVGGM